MKYILSILIVLIFAGCSTQNDEEACENGNYKKCTELGTNYIYGQGVVKDEKKAFEFYTKSCNGNDLAGCYSLGLMYFRGVGVEKNPFIANDLFLKTCENGSALGCTTIGYSHADGVGVDKINHEKAMKYFMQGCHGGDNLGCAKVGEAYEKGLGTVKNIIKAKQFYKKACSSGLEEACEDYKNLLEPSS